MLTDWWPVPLFSMGPQADLCMHGKLRSPSSKNLCHDMVTHVLLRAELPDVKANTPVASVTRDLKKGNVTITTASGQKTT